jgi:hypothetical protein
VQRRHLFDCCLLFFKGSHGLGQQPRLVFFSAEGKEKRIIRNLIFYFKIKISPNKLIKKQLNTTEKRYTEKVRNYIYFAP